MVGWLVGRLIEDAWIRLVLKYSDIKRLINRRVLKYSDIKILFEFYTSYFDLQSIQFIGYFLN